eukprot:scaffold174637_cov45-Prasinocladus_malaysianus.AAC.1
MRPDNTLIRRRRSDVRCQPVKVALNSPNALRVKNRTSCSRLRAWLAVASFQACRALNTRAFDWVAMPAQVLKAFVSARLASRAIDRSTLSRWLRRWTVYACHWESAAPTELCSQCLTALEVMPAASWPSTTRPIQAANALQRHELCIRASILPTLARWTALLAATSAHPSKAAACVLRDILARQRSTMLRLRIDRCTAASHPVNVRRCAAPASWRNTAPAISRALRRWTVRSCQPDKAAARQRCDILITHRATTALLRAILCTASYQPSNDDPRTALDKRLRTCSALPRASCMA